MRNKIILSIIIIVSIVVGVIYTNRNVAVLKGQTLFLNGNTYVECSGAYYETNKKICKVKKSNWTLYEVEGSSDYTYVVMRAFIDQQLYVRDNHTYSDKGIVTGIYIDRCSHIVNDTDLINILVNSIVKDSEMKTYRFKTDNIDSCAKEIYFCYDSNPVGTDYMGMIAYINSKWLYIKPNDKKLLSTRSGTILGIEINEEYEEILKKYFSSLIKR